LRYKKYNPNELTQEQLEKEKIFLNLSKKYKIIRNVDYFDHMISFEKFYKNALSLKDQYKIKLTNDEIKEVCLETLEVKYFDRIDNLSDSEIYKEVNEENINKAIRKLNETKKYFYDISKTTHPYIYEMILEESKKLEQYIKKLQINKTSEKITGILKKNS
jgi:hypothetical protein